MVINGDPDKCVGNIKSFKPGFPFWAPRYDSARIFAVERNHQQPDDPAKLARAIVRLANAANPPLRRPLGTDAVARIGQRNAFVNEETAKWLSLASSTDFKEERRR